MATADEYRQWAKGKYEETKDETYKLQERGRIPQHIKDEYDDEYYQGEVPLGATEDGQLATTVDEPIPESPFIKDETPPTFPTKETFADKIKSKAKKPVRTKTPRRVEVTTAVTTIWSIGSKFIEGFSLPMARTLQMQAPLVGTVVEENITKGGAFDKALQPFARVSDKAGLGAALIGTPLIVLAIEKNPQLYAQLKAPLRLCLVQWLMLAGPAAAKQAAVESEMMAAVGDIDLDGMIDMIFSPESEDANEQV